MEKIEKIKKQIKDIKLGNQERKGKDIKKKKKKDMKRK